MELIKSTSVYLEVLLGTQKQSLVRGLSRGTTERYYQQFPGPTQKVRATAKGGSAFLLVLKDKAIS